MLNIFLDTNIYLNFYRLSNEDIEKLESLVPLIKDTEDIKLFITSQVVDEFYRNRDSQISELLKKLEDIGSGGLNLPTFCKKYPDYDVLKDAYKNLASKKKVIQGKVLEDVNGFSLPPDKIIEELFSIAYKIDVTDDIISKAKLRSELGNPPGKKGSLGDAINWVCLLENVPDDEILHFVGVDNDFKSLLDNSKINSFLEREWEEKKPFSLIKYYENLSTFIKDKFPNIGELDEYRKDKQIEKLALSGSFNRSRQLLESLLKIGYFSDQQINKIVENSLSNNQVYWAQNYSPELIGEVLEKIIEGKHKIIKPENYDKFCETFNINKEIDYYLAEDGQYIDFTF